MKKKKIIIAMTLIIFTVVIGIKIYKEYRHNSFVSANYSEAEKRIEVCDYAGAMEMLKEIETDEYRDTQALIKLCKAHISYEAGYVKSAYWDVKYLDFKYLTLEQQSAVDAFMDELELAYDDYLEQRRIAEKNAYKEKVQNGVPFVGMSEGDIANTSLGSPSLEVRHNYEWISGKQYEANLYDFKEGENIIFTARCIQRKVTQVWDSRDNPVKPYQPGSSVVGKSDKKDPYDVYDYDDPEDFYYDNYDSFDGYEDAEDYWYDAWE